MGFDTYGPSQRPRPARPVDVVSVVADLDARQRQDDRRLPGKDRVSGTPVVGSSNSEQFTLTAPETDGYVVTLPGDSTLAWQVNVSARATGDATATLTLSVNSTLYPSITLSGPDKGTGPAVLIR